MVWQSNPGSGNGGRVNRTPTVLGRSCVNIVVSRVHATWEMCRQIQGRKGQTGSGGSALRLSSSSTVPKGNVAVRKASKVQTA